MNRTQWRVAYRDARKFNRFVLTFWEQLRDLKELSWHCTAVLPSFRSTRLEGDWLRYRSELHSRNYKLCHLRKRVRLPQ